MKEISILLLFYLLLPAVLGVVPARPPEEPPAGARMTEEERARLIGQLADTRKEFLDSLESLTEEQWKYTPSPARWSVGLVAEHIVLTEASLFAAAEKALATEPNPEWEAKTAGKTEFIERVLPNRTRRAQAPLEVRPQGDLSRSELIRRFKEQRERTLEFVKSTDRPLKAHTLQHPFPVFGTLNAYDWLVYIPMHTMRHNKQIAEVKALPGFPR